MNLTRCEKGHYYDMDKFTSCPHCSSSDEGMNETVRYSNPVNWDKGTVFDAGAMSPTVPYSKEMGESEDKKNSLGDLITEASGTDEPDDEGVTQSYNALNLSKEPVVGWLVCTEGENSGECWQLKTGRNFIGRSVNQDVTLSDKSVSREKHAILLYEPRRREFIVQPGDSRSLFYMNGEVVLNSSKIDAYDELMIGNTKLLFIPLCGEKFGWDDVEKGENE